MSECTIEEILGWSLEELKSKTPEQWQEILKPALAAQEQIFADISKRTKTPTTVRPSGFQPQQRLPKEKSASELLKQGLSPKQAMIAELTARGIKVTPEMLMSLKETK